jgi:hypothetical protein
LIPRIIWQTHKWEYEDLPYPFKEHSLGWQKMNPDWEYRYVSDSMALDMIKEYSKEWGEDLVEIYERIITDESFYPGNGGPHAHRADLWRYLTIYKYGGIYTDMDTECYKPLSKLDLSYEFVYEKDKQTGILIDKKNEYKTENSYGPHYFGAEKESFMIKIICLMLIEYLRRQKLGKINASASGPGFFTQSIEYFNGLHYGSLKNSLNLSAHGSQFKIKHYDLPEMDDILNPPKGLFSD